MSWFLPKAGQEEKEISDFSPRPPTGDAPHENIAAGTWPELGPHVPAWDDQRGNPGPGPKHGENLPPPGVDPLFEFEKAGARGPRVFPLAPGTPPPSAPGKFGPNGLWPPKWGWGRTGPAEGPLGWPTLAAPPGSPAPRSTPGFLGPWGGPRDGDPRGPGGPPGRDAARGTDRVATGPGTLGRLAPLGPSAGRPGRRTPAWVRGGRKRPIDEFPCSNLPPRPGPGRPPLPANLFRPPLPEPGGRTLHPWPNGETEHRTGEVGWVPGFNRPGGIAPGEAAGPNGQGAEPRRAGSRRGPG